MNIIEKFSVSLVLLLSIAGCSTHTQVAAVLPENLVQPLQPGVVRYVWEEPMVDVIDVPPGLDPDGVYYRPAHQQVVEIRQGRWQYYKDDDTH